MRTPWAREVVSSNLAIPTVVIVYLVCTRDCGSRSTGSTPVDHPKIVDFRFISFNMKSNEIIVLRQAADEVWDLARKLEKLGFHFASKYVMDASTYLHESARLETLKAKKSK